ncbi:unnamed protein product [Mytilus coruscus]|uniref:Uncharacterized protein n=1 Tax=Mytilus coruscus TaxID=42192 RepID=A0A6J8C355_MYTCO|nr:unnamed protein product [Mytilus coruscus]
MTSNRESRKRKANSNQEVLVLKLSFPAKANGSKSRRKKILLEKTNALQRLEEENLKLKRKYQALTRKQQRINRKLRDTDSPRSKANKDIQEVISKKTSADKVRRKLVLYHTMTNELKESNKMYKFKAKPKSSIYPISSVCYLKKYRMLSCTAEETGLTRNTLAGMAKLKIKEKYQRKRSLKEQEKYQIAIMEFLERSDNSTTMPNKKDVKKVNDQQKPKRILNDYIDNLYDKFRLENQTFKVSRATFYRCRPSNIMPVSFTTKRSCLCIKHQNMALMTSKGLNESLGKSDRALDKFYYRNSNEDLLRIVDDMDKEKTGFSKWQRIDIGDGRKKTGLVNVELEANEFKKELVKCADIFRQHVEMVTNQYEELRKLKENLPNGHVLAQLDFAEDYTCTTYDEVQSAYWNKTMVTIHPIVVYFRNIENGKIEHKSFAMISDELSHTAAAVLAFLRSLLSKLHELVPNMSCVHYISDSQTSQYRNRYIFNVVAEYVSLFNVPASWQYFEAGHGKGPCDGVGAMAKRMADNAVKRDKHVIQDAQSFFAWASQSESSINYIWVGKESIAQADIDIKGTELKPI